jgi:DNA uptake protein ComE-like DNA-binding protein
MVIWILVFFSILGAGLYSITGAYMSLFKRLEDRITSRYLAEAVSTAVQIARKEDSTAYDTLYELRQEKELEIGRVKAFYKLFDEEARVNINTAPGDVLTRLPGIDSETAENISSSELKPMRVKEELLFVDGITEEKYENIKDLITVYSEGAVNINTASADVLKIIGMSDSLAHAVCEFRKGVDGKETTEDDEPFKNTGEIISRLRSFISFSQAEEAILVQLLSQGRLTVSSKSFNIDCQMKILGKDSMKYVIIMDKDKIKEWREF